jgi:outer membrane receptor protein involved in Fe transport
MNALRFEYRMFLPLLFLVVALTTMGNVGAVAQETESRRELERVEISSPDRRPAARATSDAGSGYGSDQPSPSDSSPSGGQGVSSGTATGTVGPASSLSVVSGKSQVSIGAASLPAQVQVVTAQDIQQLNVWREPADLFARTAGVSVFNYSQGNLGLPIAMRGFQTSTEIAIFIDGVPLNQPSSTGGTGRVLMQWLVPEAIERIEIVKGPFSALYGDFALGGVVNIVTKKSDPSSSLSSWGGSFGAFRALGILSSGTVLPTPFLAQEYDTIDGYRDNSQLKQGSTFDKISFPTLGGVLSLRLNYFQSDWGAAGYVPIDWVKSGQWDRKRAYDPTDGGYVWRYQGVMNYAPACGERGLYATLYFDKSYDMRYCKFLPITSSQFARVNDRPYWGGRVYYNLVFGEMASLTVGGETRQDSGRGEQYNTVNRQRTTTTYDYYMRLSNWAMFLQGQIKPAEYLKIVGGVRWDYFTQQFDNLTRPQNSGTGFPFIRSPKIGFVLTPTTNLNIFGNIGCGFRSPANLEVSPYQANTASNFELEPAMVQTYDLGFNVALFGKLYLAADYYHTYMEREIKTVNNQPVNIGNTVRKGCEFEARFYPTNSQDIDVFGSYAWVDARVIDPTYPGQFLVPYISEHLIKAGVTMQRDFGSGRKVLADLYYQYISGTPGYKNTTATIPLYGPDYDMYNFKLTYSGNGWSSFFSARCQPREFSASYTWVSGGYQVFDPPPKWELASGLTYTFW